MKIATVMVGVFYSINVFANELCGEYSFIGTVLKNNQKYILVTNEDSQSEQRYELTEHLSKSLGLLENQHVSMNLDLKIKNTYKEIYKVSNIEIIIKDPFKSIDGMKLIKEKKCD